MKKLMIAVAIGCATFIANAVTYNWAASADWVSPDGNEALVDAKAYVFDANVYALSALSTSLAGGDLTVLSNAKGSFTITEDGNFEMSGSGLTDNGASPAYASMYAILVSEDQDYFYVSQSAEDVKITDAVIADGANFGFGTIETGAVGSSGWTAINVPEPTSGLLLILGMAGMALRRRRA